MPAIITAHIAQSSTRYRAVHVPAIIQAEGPFIAPYMSCAIGTIQLQHRTVTIAIVATSTARSWRAARSIRKGAPAVRVSGIEGGDYRRLSEDGGREGRRGRRNVALSGWYWRVRRDFACSTR